MQWSHYADKHQGLCLGFDIPSQKLHQVSYNRERLEVGTEEIHFSQSLDQDQVIKFLTTKYSHWSYEKEVRQFISLDEMACPQNMYQSQC